MATLTLSIGPLTSSKAATDENAQRVLESAYALFNDDDEATNQEKLDYIVQVLIPLALIGKAQQYEERVALAEAVAGVNSDPPIFS